ncbi:MAG: DUF711 family protein [Candidatus Zixiibacteriota bacterium]
MKIRTITTGISLKSSGQVDEIKPIAEFNQKAKLTFERQGYEVQTTRIATNSWQNYVEGSSKAEMLTEIQGIELVCRSLGVGFFSIGYASTPEKIGISSEIVKNTSTINCSGKIGDSDTGIDFDDVRASARVIKRISEGTENGIGNFRFCAWCNCQPGIPFFPSGYHEGKTSFSIGLECSDLLMRAFSDAADLWEAERKLKSIFEKELKPIQKIAQQLSEESKIRYAGIDASVAPSLDRNESIVFAYEKLGMGRFGQPGTLAISSVITRVLQSLSVKTCGYSGLMLPVCEDVGLVERANEKSYNLTHLLLYSAVCGCGLDAVPLPGDITVEKIEAILLDMASLAIKLNKPLSARLLPVPGKKAGEMTSFNSPYLVNCRILEVE